MGCNISVGSKTSLKSVLITDHDLCFSWLRPPPLFELQKTIYEYAFTVLVWLGNPSDDSDLAFAKIKEVGDTWRASQAEGTSDSEESTTDEESPPHPPPVAQWRRPRPNVPGRGEIVAVNEEHSAKFRSSFRKSKVEAQALFHRLANGSPQVWRAWFRRL